MSLCQPNQNFSCGACCGLLNLHLDSKELKKLLEERTTQFRNSVDFTKRWTIADYRRERENEENPILKKDPTIYVCPFLGYIDSEEKRIGCMIHPKITGDPLSQNFSFYGASICQGYDCKNKQNPYHRYWLKALTGMNLNSIEYSKLAGDVLFWKYLSLFLEENGWNIKDFSNEYRELFQEIIYHRLKFGNPHVTSFEIDMTEEKDFKLKLCSLLNLQINEKICRKLEGVKPREGL